MYKICIMYNTVSDPLEYINNSEAKHKSVGRLFHVCCDLQRWQLYDIECCNHHEHDGKVDSTSSVNDSTAGLAVFFFCFLSVFFLIYADVGFMRKLQT